MVVTSQPRQHPPRAIEEILKRWRSRRFQQPKPERAGKYWYLRIRQDEIVGGARTRKLKRIKVAPASTPEREVKKIAAEILRPVNQGLISVGSAVNFNEYVQTTYIPTELPLLAKTTQDSYRGVIAKHLLEVQPVVPA